MGCIGLLCGTKRIVGALQYHLKRGLLVWAHCRNSEARRYFFLSHFFKSQSLYRCSQIIGLFKRHIKRPEEQYRDLFSADAPDDIDRTNIFH